jgi:hypothetical protein
MDTTEAEALMKWCHRTGRAGPELASACLASGCMAWRWLDEDDREDALHRGKVKKKPKKGKEKDPPIWVSEKERRGYCGLAGSVE